MARYPDITVQKFNAAMVQAMIPDITVKQTSGPSRASLTTLTNDAELAGISLEVGTFKVDVLLYATGTTGDLRTAWSFTGAWSGTRACLGPGPATELQSQTDAPMRDNALALGTAATYGLNNATTPAVIREVSYNVVVTTAGTMAVQWAQETSDVSATSVLLGSAVEVRRIA